MSMKMINILDKENCPIDKNDLCGLGGGGCIG